MTIPYPAIPIQRRSGDKPFHAGSRALDFDVASFWRWGASDLMDNLVRGMLAEFLVAQAMGKTDCPRVGWDACDIRTDRVTVEVKSSAYLQSWPQERLSNIRFSIAPKRGWNAETNEYAPRACRDANVYVFALLSHRDKATVDPLDVEQWAFHVVPTSSLETAFGTNKSIGLASLRRVCPAPVTFDGLRDAIFAAGAIAREDDDG